MILRGRSLSPLLITCEHASRSAPAGIGPVDAETRALLRTHRGWDVGIWEVVSAVSRFLGATAVGGRYSRLAVDLNRDPSDTSLIVSEADGVAVSFNARITPREAGRRVSRLHAPYHAEIDRQLARRTAAGVCPLLVSFHSFTPYLNPRRRRFDAGVLFRDHPRLARRFGRELERQGFSVRYNRPYSGLEGLIYAAARHGSSHRIPYLELELNQRLLGKEADCRSIARRAAAALSGLLPRRTDAKVQKSRQKRDFWLP